MEQLMAITQEEAEQLRRREVACECGVGLPEDLAVHSSVLGIRRQEWQMQCVQGKGRCSVAQRRAACQTVLLWKTLGR